MQDAIYGARARRFAHFRLNTSSVLAQSFLTLTADRLVLVLASLSPSGTCVLTELRLLIIIVFAPGEVNEAVHVTCDGHAMIVGAAWATHNPLVTQLHVHALRLYVSLGGLVVDWRRHGVLNGIVAERALVVQADVPTGLNSVIVGATKRGQKSYNTDRSGCLSG